MTSCSVRNRKKCSLTQKLFPGTRDDPASLVGGKRRLHMRSITFMGTAVAVLTSTTFLAIPASADRVCHKVCHEGSCRTTCVQRNDRLYMHERDRDYYHHRRSGVEL